MTRKFIVRQNLSKMNNNLEKTESLTTCKSKSINNFGILNKLCTCTIKECVRFFKFKNISSGVPQKQLLRNGHYTPPAQGTTVPDRLLSQQVNIPNTVQDSKEESCTMVILSLSPTPSKLSFSGSFSAPIETAISPSILD